MCRVVVSSRNEDGGGNAIDDRKTRLAEHD